MSFKYDTSTAACRAAHAAGEMTLLRYLNHNERANVFHGRGYSFQYIAMGVVQDALLALEKALKVPAPPRCEPGDSGWNTVEGGGVPCGATLETYRAGERGTTLSCVRILHTGDEPEWIDVLTGVTTVTHSTYVPPTHWRWPQAAKFCEHCDRGYGEVHTDYCTRTTETFCGRPPRAEKTF